MKIVWASVTCLAVLSSVARGAIVYETAGDTNNLYDQIAGDNFTAYGDEVNLGGTAREITSITIPFSLPDFPEDGFPANYSYTPNLTLTLYQDNGTVTSTSDTITNGWDPPLGGITRPGTVIASSTVTGSTLVPVVDGNPQELITFTFNDVLVPSTFSFVVTQNNLTPNPNDPSDFTSVDNFSIDLSNIGGVAGPAQPQIVGSHNGFVWVQDANTGLFEATNYGYTVGGPQYAGVQATIVAVPEPSTFFLAAVGLAACALVRRARRCPR